MLVRLVMAMTGKVWPSGLVALLGKSRAMRLYGRRISLVNEGEKMCVSVNSTV